MLSFLLTIIIIISLLVSLFKGSQREDGLFMLVSYLFPKIPNWLKLLLISFLFIILFEVFSNLYYLNLYLGIVSSLIILYELLNLYLIHKFSNKNISISPVLPDFLINWLSEYKEICSTEESIQVFKKMSYIQISIYASILVFIILIS